MKKSNLAKSHDAMLSFLESLIRNSDKWPRRTPRAQKHYDKAKKLVAQAIKAQGIAVSSTDRGGAAS